MSITIGGDFRYKYGNIVYNAKLIYNGIDEDYKYMVLNTDNWEIIDSFKDVRDIETFDVLKQLVKLLIQNDKRADELVYRIDEDGYFFIRDTQAPFEWGSIIYEYKLTPEELNRAAIVCDIYGVARQANSL